MGAQDILNKPVTATLCGKKYKLRRLSSLEIIAVCEEYIIEQKVKSLKALAKALPEDERTAFVSASLAGLPEGVDLESLAREMLDNPEEKMPNAVAARMMHESMSQFNDELSVADVSRLFDDAEQDEVTLLFGKIVGKADAPERRNSKSSPSRTAGRRKQ